jgi:hypothetical protein
MEGGTPTPRSFHVRRSQECLARVMAKTPVGVEPTSTGLQPVAWPSGSSVTIRMPSPGIEPGPRPSQSRMRIRHTPRTTRAPSPPPGNRTRPCGFEHRRAPDTLAGNGLKKCPRQESNLVSDLRRVACESGTLQGRFLIGRHPIRPQCSQTPPKNLPGPPSSTRTVRRSLARVQATIAPERASPVHPERPCPESGAGGARTSLGTKWKTTRQMPAWRNSLRPCKFRMDDRKIDTM